LLQFNNGETPQCANTNGASVSNNPARKIDMNIVATSDFNFQGFSFNTVSEAGAVWFTSTDLAKALGYKKTDAISQIYARNSDEFTKTMSMTLNMRVNGINNSLRNKSVRIYSLRGCHLIAMFATTDKAKEFRRWVLDILDREVEHSPITKQFTDEELITMSYLWSWMDRSQKLCRTVYPAMRDVESRYTGMFHDVGKETLYVIEESRKVLAREIAHIKSSNSVRAKRAAAVMARVCGEELPDMYH
jgi:prophage antirepressor-like protein